MRAQPKNQRKSAADPAARVAQVPVVSLLLSDYNPRRISEEQLSQLEKSITRFRMVEPIVANRRADGSLVVVGGHQRVKILRRLKRRTVPTVILRLPPAEEKLLNLALNKLGGEWDLSQLARIVAELRGAGQSLEDAGFGEEETAELLRRAEREAAALREFQEVKLDVEGSIKCPNCGYELKPPLRKPAGPAGRRSRG